MSVVLAPVSAAISENIRTRIPKNMVLDLKWFNGD